MVFHIFQHLPKFGLWFQPPEMDSSAQIWLKIQMSRPSWPSPSGHIAIEHWSFSWNGEFSQSKCWICPWSFHNLSIVIWLFTRGQLRHRPGHGPPSLRKGAEVRRSWRGSPGRRRRRPCSSESWEIQQQPVGKTPTVDVGKSKKKLL